MRANAGLPCHHPKWPMQCPHCGNPADGFNVNVPLRQHWDAEAKEMRMLAWGTTGMACFDCRTAILPNAFSEGITPNYVEALVQSDIPGTLLVTFVPGPWFDEHCRLPAEEPVKTGG